jgi:hypothetical protein
LREPDANAVATPPISRGLRNLKTAGGISARVYDEIVDANPRAA